MTDYMCWYNFKMSEDEFYPAGIAPPVERYPEFIPQVNAALNLYQVLLKMDYTPDDALLEVLSKMIGNSN